jgi:pimeloyl-ACP methyl ester carboxylesterase
VSSLIQTIDINGYRCRYTYEARTNRPTVIVLAGALQEIESLDALISLFKHYNLYVVELPGQGGSDALEENYTCDFLASCLEKFVSRFIKEPFYLFAYSYANLISIEYLKNARHLPEKAILAAAMSDLPEDQRLFIQGLIQLKPKDCVEAFMEFITNDSLNSKQHMLFKRASIRYSHRYIKRHPSHFYNNTKRLLSYSIGDISQIKTKCMTMAGELDPFVKPEFSKDLANKLSNCVHTTIESSDHLFYLEQPGKTQKAIEQFFD